MKKIEMLLICLLSFTSFVFASGSSESSQESIQGLKVAIITSPSGVDDGSYNENIYDGCVSFVEKNEGSSVTPLREPSGIVDKIMKLSNDVVVDYDVEVCCGFQFSGISEIAKDNPDTNFILVDSFPAGDEVVDNLYAMIFAEQESGFFAGIAAALESQTKKVAVLTAEAYPSNVNYQYGFECGVKYANAKFNTNVDCVELPSQAGTDVNGTNVGGNYIGSFNDPATAKIVANQLIDENVDIIFVAAGGSGVGAFTAAKESDGKCLVIGVDVDQWDEGMVNGDNIILTSALKKMDINVDRVLTKINNGTFKGENVVLNATTDSTGYVKEEGRHQLSQGTISKLDATYELVKNGTIIPASNFGGFSPDEFVVE
jgi:basic membrane protein A